MNNYGPQPTPQPRPLPPYSPSGRLETPAVPRLSPQLNNYASLSKDSRGHWCITLHRGGQRTPLGLNGYPSAEACYRELMGLAKLDTYHILLTRDFLDALQADWDEADRQAQYTPQQWELP